MEQGKKVLTGILGPPLGRPKETRNNSELRPVGGAFSLADFVRGPINMRSIRNRSNYTKGQDRVGYFHSVPSEGPGSSHGFAGLARAQAAFAAHEMDFVAAYRDQSIPRRNYSAPVHVAPPPQLYAPPGTANALRSQMLAGLRMDYERPPPMTPHRVGPKSLTAPNSFEARWAYRPSPDASLGKAGWFGGS